jgi:reductive dehalogenase
MSRTAAPNLGRTVRIVDDVVNVSYDDTPHPKVRRGEMGTAMYNLSMNMPRVDPLVRALAAGGIEERNLYRLALARVPRSETNPTKTLVRDPAAMSRHIKEVALAFGAGAVGIAASHPSFFYAKGARHNDGRVNDQWGPIEDSPEELARRFPFIISTPVPLDHEMIQAHRHFIGDIAYGLGDVTVTLVRTNLARYIAELGYAAEGGIAIPHAAAIASGLGELGRNGMVITRKFGAQVLLGDCIATDLPLVADHPIDLGVEDFCKICRKCAVTCPTNSITFGDKVVWNGIEKYKIKWESCYRLRPYVADHWGTCLTCITVCPYSKPNTWWHGLALRVLRTTPVALRPGVVWPLKWLDDTFWGKVPRKRVRWLGYDSGIKPGEKACTIPGCDAPHGDGGEGESIQISATHRGGRDDVGYYFPLKENTNRFVKKG